MPKRRLEKAEDTSANDQSVTFEELKNVQPKHVGTRTTYFALDRLRLVTWLNKLTPSARLEVLSGKSPNPYGISHLALRAWVSQYERGKLKASGQIPSSTTKEFQIYVS